jgi:hypothetical protein
MRARPWYLLAIAVLLAGSAAAGCSAPTGSGTLSVTNGSQDTFYIRLETAPDQVRTYRIEPGAAGRVEGVDPARRPDTMTVYAADCTEMMRESEPALGQLHIEAGSLVSTAAVDPDLASRPLLPLDEACP